MEFVYFLLHFRTVVFVAQFEHPYKPWTKEHGDEKQWRIFKAQENQLQWTVFALPLAWVAGLYGPGAPTVAGVPLGKLAPWANLGLCLAYAKFNRDYATGYMESAEVI